MGHDRDRSRFGLSTQVLIHGAHSTAVHRALGASAAVNDGDTYTVSSGNIDISLD